MYISYSTWLCWAVLSHSVASDSVTRRTVVRQAPLSRGTLQAVILEWIAMPSSRGSSQPKDWTQVSGMAGRFFYHRNHQGSLRIVEWVAYPFSRGSSWPRNQTRVSCIAGRYFTCWTIRKAHSTWLLPYKKKNSVSSVRKCMLINSVGGFGSIWTQKIIV